MSYTKTAVFTLGLMVSASLFAIDGPAIVKNATPNVVTVVAGGGTGLSQFSVMGSDFASNILSRTKTLRSIDYRTTSYPNNTERVELCYFPPYATKEVGCSQITQNTSGEVTQFRLQNFGNGARVIIRHTMLGGPAPARPQGSESVTFRYDYF